MLHADVPPTPISDSETDGPGFLSGEHAPIAPFAQPELAHLQTKVAANEHALEGKGAELAKRTVNCAAAPPACRAAGWWS